MEQEEVYTVFSRDDCPWCDRVKALLEMKKVKYEVINLSNDKNSLDWFRDQGFRTVPQVYKGSKWIGGYEKVKDFLDND